MERYDNELEMQLVSDLETKQEEIQKKIEQWQRLNVKIDEVLEKIKNRKVRS